MPEYFTMEIETTNTPEVMELITNQQLTAKAEEVYSSPEEGDEGSPIAQTLFFAVDGIQALTIKGDTLIVTRTEEASWEGLIDDIRDVLRDFFL